MKTVGTKKKHKTSKIFVHVGLNSGENLKMESRVI